MPYVVELRALPHPIPVIGNVGEARCPVCVRRSPKGLPAVTRQVLPDPSPPPATAEPRAGRSCCRGAGSRFASRSTSSQRRVVISPHRHPVSISSRSAAAAHAPGAVPSASSVVQHLPETAKLLLRQEPLQPARPVLGHEAAGVATRRDQPPRFRLIENARQSADRLVRRGGRHA